MQLMQLDETDERILNELTANSKTKLRDLAKKTNVSFVTALNRIKKMEKSGVIKGYTTKIDYEKLGYDINALIMVRIAKGRFFELEEKIAKNPEVVAVYDITGNYDAVVVAKFKSRRSLDSFLKKVQMYPFIERTETNLILNTIREENVKLVR